MKRGPGIDLKGVVRPGYCQFVLRRLSALSNGIKRYASTHGLPVSPKSSLPGGLQRVRPAGVPSGNRQRKCCGAHAQGGGRSAYRHAVFSHISVCGGQRLGGEFAVVLRRAMQWLKAEGFLPCLFHVVVPGCVSVIAYGVNSSSADLASSSSHTLRQAVFNHQLMELPHQVGVDAVCVAFSAGHAVV